ncbi:MAG: DMT family transporter [Thermoleophilia bacterium]
MAAVLLACLTGLVLGGLNVSSHAAVRRTGDVRAGATAMTAVALVVAVVAALAVGVHRADLRPGQVWPFLAIGAVVPGVTQVLALEALDRAGPSRSAIVFGTAPLLSAVLAIALLDEPVRAPLLVGAALVVLGGTAIALERRRPGSFQRIGLVLAGITALLIAGRDVATRWALGHTQAPPVVQTATLLLAATASLLVLLALDRRGGAPGPRLRTAALPFLPVGLLVGGAYVALLEAFEHGPVGVVSPLYATSVLWTVVLSAAFLRTDRIRPRVVLAALLVVGGAALIGATRGSGDDPDGRSAPRPGIVDREQP